MIRFPVLSTITRCKMDIGWKSEWIFRVLNRHVDELRVCPSHDGNALVGCVIRDLHHLGPVADDEGVVMVVVGYINRYADVLLRRSTFDYLINLHTARSGTCGANSDEAPRSQR